MPGVPVCLVEKIDPKPHSAIVQMNSLQSEKLNANQTWGWDQWNCSSLCIT